MNIHIDFGFHFQLILNDKKFEHKKELTQYTGQQTGIMAPTQSEPLAATLESAICQLEPARSKGTVENYRTAVRSFLSYTGPDIMIHEITPRLLEGYERWMQQRSIKAGTRSCYLRSLRSLLNTIGSYSNCFKNVHTGKCDTEKRALSTEDVRTLEDLQLTNRPAIDKYRDYFLFSFYAMGMPFVDMAYLRHSNVKDGYIVYERHKTGKQVRVKIEKPLQQIINRYAHKDSEYLLPIITTKNPEEVQQQYVSALNNYNRGLKTLAKLAGLRNLTSYMARHSWASIAFANNIDLPVISKALGHKSTQTTLYYISEINDDRVYNANTILIQELAKTAGNKLRKTGN